jgi:hypothetical protein
MPAIIVVIFSLLNEKKMAKYKEEKVVYLLP